MRTFTLALVSLGSLATMIGMNALSRQEVLQVDDGNPAAGVLPLDRDSALTPFETATFGLG